LTGYGLQTQDFIKRLETFTALPPLLQELAQVMLRLIQEIESPQLEDILRLQGELRSHIGEPARLRSVCGTEGKLCSQCPFGAYLPSGFPFASEDRAVCLPWIVVVHPQPEQPPAPVPEE
jgi:hypothetical protein